MSVQITFNKAPFDIDSCYWFAEGHLYCMRSEMRPDSNGIQQCYIKYFPILNKKEKAKILLTHSSIK